MISKIHTSCKNCVFAIYDENHTQTSCFANYLDKYKEKGAEIIEVYDNDKEFYILNDKKCLGYRENKWFDTIGMGESDISEKLSRLNEENKLSYVLMVDLKDFLESSLSDISKQLNQIENKPSKIIIIKYDTNKNISYEHINDFFKSLNFSTEWRIQNMLDDSVSHENIVHSIVNGNKKYRFVCVIKNPTQELVSVISKTIKTVFDELEAFVIISDKNKDCYLFSSIVYRYYLFIENIDILTNYDYYMMI